MSHRAFAPAVALLGCLALVLAVSSPVGAAPADDEKKPAKPAGPKYQNKKAGVSARGPVGWRMRADEGGPVEWSRLVTFYDPATDADAVFSVRKKSAKTVSALLNKVRKEWAGAKGVRITGTRAVERSPLVKVAHVVVDGGFVKRPKAKKGQDPSMRPPPIPYRVRATYYLGPDGEYLLYAKAQDTHWSRIQGKLRAMGQSLTFAKSVVAAPTEGQNRYSNDKLGFTCSFPSTSVVHVSKYANQVVGFRPLDATNPKIEIYRLSYDGGIDNDAKRMLNFYIEDQAGEGELRATRVAGKEAALVAAKADIGGVAQTIYVAIFERSDGKVWRIKLTGPVDQDEAVQAALKTFLDGFKLTAAN